MPENDGSVEGSTTPRREFLKYLAMMAAASGIVTNWTGEEIGWPRGETPPVGPIDGSEFADQHRDYHTPPRHDQYTAGEIPVRQDEARIETGDGIEATATTARLWADGLPYGVSLRGTRQQAWRHQFTAERIDPGGWTKISELNYGFVTYPPHMVPILRLYAVLDQPETRNQHSNVEFALRVLQATTTETIFEVSATDPDHAIRYQEWPLSELEFGSAGTSRKPEQARFVIQARAINGPATVRPSSLGLDMEVL